MPIDARIEAERLRNLYAEDPLQNSVNILLLGEKGTGKTNLLKTARKPVYIDSFDPEGTLTLRDDIKRGDIIVNTEWENEDRLNPSMYVKWKNAFEAKLRDNMAFFHQLGTYCIDSSTTWSFAVMNQILKTANRAGQSPEFFHDYKPQRNEMENRIGQFINLPCDFIFTGHLEAKYRSRQTATGEEVRDVIGYQFLTTGKGVVLIPLLFSELWVMVKEAKGGKVEYKILTNNKGLYSASTRIGAGGKLLTEEEPNLKNIYKKCGLPFNDKPSLFAKKETKNG